MKLHQLRNATVIIEYSGKRFLIDPMFAPKGANNGEGLDEPIIDKPWPLHDLPLPPKDIIKNIDAVIITHLHTDHFDKYAQEILPKNTKIFVQDMFDKNALEKEHFNNIEIIKTEGINFEGVTFYKTECRHGIREKAEPIFLANGMRWETMGVVFKSDNEPALYMAGDTIWYDSVKKSIEEFSPKYIIISASRDEVGKNIPINMGLEDIVLLHNYYPEGKIIANHLDCVDISTVSRSDINSSEVNEYVYVPVNGEIMLLE